MCSVVSNGFGCVAAFTRLFGSHPLKIPGTCHKKNENQVHPRSQSLHRLPSGVKGLLASFGPILTSNMFIISGSL